MGSCALPYYDKETGRIEHGTESHVLGVNLLLKKILSALEAQNGDMRLEITFMRKTAF